MPIHIVARHFARPDSVPQVRDILLSLIAPSRAEAGCLKYELLQNIDDATDFTFVETFVDRAAVTLHASSSYVSGLAARLEGLTAKPSEVSLYEAVAADDRHG